MKFAGSRKSNRIEAEHARNLTRRRGGGVESDAEVGICSNGVGDAVAEVEGSAKAGEADLRNIDRSSGVGDRADDTKSIIGS